jgi:hypothetical protein
MSMASGIAIAAWLLVKKVLFGTDLLAEHGPLMVFGIVLFLAGLQLISSGLLGELVSRTYFESQGKPIYSIEKIIASKTTETGR